MEMNKSVLGIAAALVVGGIFAAPASAAFVLKENFEDVALNANLADANEGESFTLAVQSGQTPSATVVASPWDALSHAALIANPGASLQMPLGGESIAQGTIGTLFYQIYRTGLVNMSSGLSDVADITSHNFGNFESQLNINAMTSPQPIRVRGAGSFLPGGVDMQEAELYNVWHYIDNTADTSEVYVQQVGVDPAPVQLVNGDTTAFAFRNAAAPNDIVQFLFMTGAANTTDAGHTSVYLDNIYVDTTGKNIANPVPEPASLAVLGIGAAFLAARRRR
jgi:hypothetical protein